MTESIVVLFNCVDGEDCRYAGYDVHGNEAWSLDVPERSDIEGFHSLSLMDQLQPAPHVVVTGTGPLTVRDPETGEPLAEYPGKTGVLDRDVLIAVEPDGGDCHLTAARGPEVLWTATITEATCKSPELAGAFVVLSDDDVILVDRETQEVARLQAPRWAAARQVVGHTLVFDNEEAIAGVDARTGAGTWRWETGGPHGVVGAGPAHVLVGTRPTGWNPFISAAVREDGLLFHLLDAATGQTVVRAIHPEAVDSTTVLDRAFVIDDEGVLTLYGPPPLDPRS